MGIPRQTDLERYARCCKELERVKAENEKLLGWQRRAKKELEFAAKHLSPCVPADRMRKLIAEAEEQPDGR